MSWEFYFQENKIIPLTIWYKDLETETQQKDTLNKVLDFLGITDMPSEPKVWVTRQDTKWDQDLYNQTVNHYRL